MFPPLFFPSYATFKGIPNASKTEIVGTMGDGTIKIRIAAQAEKGKANAELIRFFKKEYGLVAIIVGGESDRKKLVRFEK